LQHFQIHKSRAKLPQQKMSSPSNLRASSTIIFHSEHRVAKQQATKKVLHTFPGFDLARNQFFLIHRYAQIYYASAKWSFLQQVTEHTLPLGASDRHNAIPKHSILQFQCFYIEPHLLFHYVEPTFVNDGKEWILTANKRTICIDGFASSSSKFSNHLHADHIIHQQMPEIFSWNDDLVTQILLSLLPPFQCHDMWKQLSPRHALEGFRV
jgi:hypothetical protein